MSAYILQFVSLFARARQAALLTSRARPGTVKRFVLAV
jgi:hypothetical protein